MLERGRGTVLLSGATMAIRGGAKFACQSPIKFGLRSLGQSMFQSYAPQGVNAGLGRIVALHHGSSTLYQIQ